MTTKTIYTCDICGKSYDTSAEATTCESSHGTPTLFRCQYGTTTISGIFPESVIISAGGKKAQYTYFRTLKDES